MTSSPIGWLYIYVPSKYDLTHAWALSQENLILFHGNNKGAGQPAHQATV